MKVTSNIDQFTRDELAAKINNALAKAIAYSMNKGKPMSEWVSVTVTTAEEGSDD